MVPDPRLQTDSTADAPIRDYSGEDYREFWQGPGRSLLERLELDMVARLLSPGPGRLIDLGCGYGRLVPAYLRPDRQVVLVDYARNLLELAGEAYPTSNVHLVLADAARLPFRDGMFDLGVSVRVFHHMAAPAAFLRELGRVMRPAASAVVSYSNKRNPARMMRHGFSSFRRDHEQYDRLLFGTHPRYFARLCAEADFEIARLRGTGVLDQVLRVAPGAGPLLERSRAVNELVSRLEVAADEVLGPLGLAPLEFAELRKPGSAPAAWDVEPELETCFACPRCRSTGLRSSSDLLECSGCGARFARHGRIYDFRQTLA